MFPGMHHCRPPGRGGGGGWGWGFGPPGGPPPPPGMPFGGRGPGRGRMFGHGDLKFVVLHLLADKPRHGYEIIKEMEERFGGTYSPSPGIIYPTLSLLEDLGYATAQVEKGNRKVFEITEEGRAFLEANRGTVADVLGRMEGFGARVPGPAMATLGKSFGNLRRAALQAAMRAGRDEAALKRIKEILERTARELDGDN